MPEEPLVSHAQNGEDVILWRALGGVRGGTYVDVGAWDPDVDSVTRLFYDRGWRGVHVEPIPELADRLRRRRPLDDVIEAAITDEAVDTLVLHQFGSTGLSTLDDDVAAQHDRAGLGHSDIEVPARRLDDVLAGSELVGDTIHFLKIDVEGAEDRVLRSIDLTRWLPWVLVIEATEPNSTVTTHQRWEQLVHDAGYTFTLFDGLSRYYVSPHHPELTHDLSYAACTLDAFVTAHQHEQDRQVDLLTQEADQARRDVVRWRNQAVMYWSDAVAQVQRSEDDAAKARTEAKRSRAQLSRVRARLQQVRADRERLGRRVRNMDARIKRLEQERSGASAGPGRLRTVMSRVLRA